MLDGEQSTNQAHSQGEIRGIGLLERDRQKEFSSQLAACETVPVEAEVEVRRPSSCVDDV